MSTSTLLLLIFVAFLLAWADQFFFAFLTVVLAALLALLGGKKSSSVPSGSGGGGPGQVVVGGGQVYPNDMKIKFQPDWGGGKTGNEEIGSSVGGAVDFVGKSAFGLLRFIFPKKNDKED
ncbi:MAG: hypothetical protein ACE5DI_01805 [Candidatus Micrarchaeia archaeon]